MSPPVNRPAVLLVDDNTANLIALGAVLHPLNVRTVEAHSGAAALRRVERESFAAVLLDVQMPGMDGFETAERLRALPNGREVPILFLTAIHGDEQYAKRGYATGAADYITKPFDADILRARVRAFVDLYQQREEAHRIQFEARTRERDEAQRRLSAFERIATAALETDDLEAFLQSLLTVFIGAADSADTGTILLRRGDRLQPRASTGLSGGMDMTIQVPVGAGFAGQIAATGRALFLAESEIDAVVYSSELRGRGLRALYGVPLVYEGDVIGVAHIGSTTAREFSASEKSLLSAMVERAAWAVSRQIARDRLYAVLDSAPALISIWRGPDYVCEFANEAFRKQHGGRELVGMKRAELGVTPDIAAAFERVLRNGETVALEEHLTTADFQGEGLVEERYYNFTFLPLRSAMGEPEAVLSFAVDLTPQVRARQALEQSERQRAQLLELERTARRESEIANRTKDEFLATVSHELRTPLNAILGWAASLRRGVVKDLDRALGVIERNARAQARIVDDVLDLSRIASGKLRLDVAAIEISTPLSGAIEAVRPAAEAKGLVLDVGIDAGLGLVAADADRIQQIAWNLLSNAVKFTPRGGTVRLTAQQKAQDIVVCVSDSGQGIASSFLPHVFEAFRQADASTTRSHGGLGLGLAIVKQLVMAHGGTIQAESEGEGHGAQFTVHLPAPRAAAAGAARTRRAGGSIPPEADPVRLDNVRVLVVDDEEDSRLLVGEVLAAEGALVEFAASAEEALQTMSHFKPDVLVTDIGMPKIDGYAFLRQLRTRPAESGGDTPAIALTAYARSEDRERAHDAGFQMHLAKPVDPLELISRVADLGMRSASAAVRP